MTATATAGGQQHEQPRAGVSPVTVWSRRGSRDRWVRVGAFPGLRLALGAVKGPAQDWFFATTDRDPNV